MDTDIKLKIQKIIDCAQNYPELKLLMLFGSRARSDAKEHSDWDFAFLATKDFDPTDLYVNVTLIVETDKVDLVNLSKSTALLRFRVTQDGIPLYESCTGEYEKFWLQAVDFWCDAGPIIRAEYEALFRRIA